MPTKITIVYQGYKRFKNVNIRSEVVFFKEIHVSFQDIFQLPDVFLSEFEDTIQGTWMVNIIV